MLIANPGIPRAVDAPRLKVSSSKLPPLIVKSCPVEKRFN
jgi:hypothetical protein